MKDCPNCEYHKQRAQLWRHEAYKLSGHPLDWEPDLMQRAWQGLTDGELPPLAGDNGKYMELQQVRRFYKRIEAKLKEKNNA